LAWQETNYLKFYQCITEFFHQSLKVIQIVIARPLKCLCYSLWS